MKTVKRLYETLKAVLFWCMVILYATGILRDWTSQYTSDPLWWKQALLFMALALMIATGCSIAMGDENRP